MNQELHQALEAAERRFRNVVEKIADGIVIVDLQGRVRYANPAAEKLFARTRSELEDHPLGFPLVPGETTQVTLARPDPETLMAEMRVVETEWSGEPAYLASLREVTDRKRLKEERRQHLEERIARVEAEANSRRLHLVAEAGALLASSVEHGTTVEPFAGLVVGPFADGCIVALQVDPDAPGSLPAFTVAHRDPRKHEALEELASQFDPGASSFPGLDDAWKQESSIVLHGVDLSDLPEALPMGIRSLIHVPLGARGSTFGTVSFLLTEGPTPTLLANAIYQPPDRLLAEELGRHLALHLENARLFREAEAANRLRDEFLATISHELRTPLQAILGWTELLRQADSEDEQIERAAEVIERNAEAQQHLVDDMLDVSRIITGRLRLDLRRIDVTEPVQAAIESVEPTAHSKGLRLAASYPEPSPRVTVDPHRFQQIVWNLLSNSIKFTPAGGRVEVEVRQEETSVVLEVRDDGQGIEPELLPHIFHRFRRGRGFADQGGEGGLGLGLSIVQHLVEMHGGRIEAASDGPGRGATFRVHLPARPLATAPMPPNPETAHTRRANP